MGSNAIPELQLQGNVAENWDFWRKRFENYLIASELSKKEEAVQCALLLHLIGAEGYRIYNSFTIQEEEKDNIQVLLKKFEEHFKPRSNTAFERYKFFLMRQNDMTVDQYITALRNQANKCKLEGLKDSLIKTMIVCGVNSNQIREKLLQEDSEELSLDKAISLCSVMNESKAQAEKMKEPSAPTEAVQSISRQQGSRHNQHGGRSRSVERRRDKSTNRHSSFGGPSGQKSIKDCRNCGGSHLINNCRAYGKKCDNCGRLNHFAKMCRSKTIKTISKYSNIDRSSNTNTHEVVHCDAVINSINSSNQASWEVELQISNKSYKFKIDTGSDANVLPFYLFKQLQLPLSIIKANNTQLKSYTGNNLKIRGTVKLNCRKEQNSYEILFYVVETSSQALLGLQTCIELNLIKRIYSVQNTLSKMLNEFTDLFNGIGCMKLKYHIKLKENVTPKISPIRKVPLPLMNSLKNILDELENNEIIAKVSGPSDWIHPLVLVKKPNGQIRICMDPKFLNEAIKREHCVIETFEEISSKLKGAKYFTSLDATSGFYQIPLSEESANLCTVGTPFGRYKFLRLPYGVKSAPEVFHNTFKNIFNFDGVAIYIDDILVWGETIEEHNIRLRKVLETAKRNGIKLNKEKCKFALKEIKYMGHIITDKGVRPDNSKIEAILKMPSPKSKLDVQRILGVLNYINKFIPNFSTDTSVIRELLKKDSEFRWEPEHETALNKIKDKLTQAPVLQFYDVNLPVVISVDSSTSGSGAVVLQNNLPVAYASKALTETQQRYSQLEKEMLAICFGLTRFHDYVYGKQDVIVETDHLPLLGIFKKPLNQAPARVQRMLLLVQKYEFQLKYKRGKDLIIADALSRAYLADEIDSDLDAHIAAQVNLIQSETEFSCALLDEIKMETGKDTELQELNETVLKGWPNNKKHVKQVIKQYAKYKGEITNVNGILYKGQSIIIPKIMRGKILQEIHYAHLGITKCTKLAETLIYWPGIKNDIKQFIENCTLCQKYANSQHSEPLNQHEIPLIPWFKVGCDLFDFKNSKYLLVVDYYTKFVEVEHLHTNTSSHKVIEVLKNMFARHGIPNTLISDGGPQFSSELFKHFSNEWKFNHNITSPHYPQSNGMVERHIQTIKNILRKGVEENKEVPLLLLHYRNTPIDNNLSPAELLMSRKLRSSLPINPLQLKPKAIDYQKYNKKLQQKRKWIEQYYNARYQRKQLPPLSIGSRVLMQTKPGHREWSPGTIIDKINKYNYKIKIDNGSVLVRNRKFIKKYKDLNNSDTKAKKEEEENSKNKHVTFAPLPCITHSFNPNNFTMQNFGGNDTNKTPLVIDPNINVNTNQNIEIGITNKTRSGREIKRPVKLNSYVV